MKNVQICIINVFLTIIVLTVCLISVMIPSMSSGVSYLFSLKYNGKYKRAQSQYQQGGLIAVAEQQHQVAFNRVQENREFREWSWLFALAESCLPIICGSTEDQQETIK